jgi:hypothetical protein
LARGFSGRAIGQQLLRRERPGMRRVGVQGQHQCRTVLDDPNARMTMAVNPTLVTLGQAEPSFQVEWH